MVFESQTKLISLIPQGQRGTSIFLTLNPGMIADALKDVSRRGDLVFDPFLGSGSTLLAAEETGRICLGVELDPGYVEVAIRRWEKRTRRDAVHADTGQTFSFLCEQASARPPAVEPTIAEINAEDAP
jgi:tRNA/tmRNA/rRNA uracil-C5-methylase (TrmA/RlmC/RlmD family)